MLLTSRETCLEGPREISRQSIRYSCKCPSPPSQPDPGPHIPQQHAAKHDSAYKPEQGCSLRKGCWNAHIEDSFTSRKVRRRANNRCSSKIASYHQTQLSLAAVALAAAHDWGMFPPMLPSPSVRAALGSRTPGPPCRRVGR